MKAEGGPSFGTNSSLLSAGLSGVLVALAFPTASWLPVIFVALVPLLLAVQGRGPTSASLLGWLGGTR